MILVRMRHRSYLPGVLLAIFSAACVAQVAPVKTRYPVTGSVVNSVTGEPIRRALVSAGSGDLAFTGADGRFQMDLPEGQTVIVAQKPGFFDSRSSPNVRVSQHSTFAVGSGKNDIVLKLIPEATIQGRILDSDGEPIEGTQVQLAIEQIVNGRRELQSLQTGSTNEDGTYRIGGLAPGAYLVHTEVHPLFSQFGNALASSQLPAQVYPQRFYPGSPDISGAQPIDLKPGQEAQVDFTLSPVRAFRIMGSIAGAQNGAFVSIEDAEGQQMFASMNFDQQTGHFVLPNVPSGFWILNFGSPSSQGDSLFAEQLVTVSSSDVDGLQVLLQPLPSIRVEVTNPGEAGTPQVQVQLISKDKHRNRRLVANSPSGDAHGPSSTQGAEPGEYRVLAQPLGNACVESVFSGSTDLMQNNLIIAAGSELQPINVVLRKDCATVSGTINSETQTANGLIVLVAHSISTEPKVIPIMPGGSFTFANLTPGEYQIYAFSNIDGLEYANPEALRDFAGQKIELAPNQKLNVSLDLIARGSN